MTLTSSSDSGTKSIASPIRVLFADDSAAIRTLARYSLSARRGFSVVAEAADGAEVLSLFDIHKPDCVVLDIEMPGIGGFEALEDLQRKHPSTPVVMLSGFSDRSTSDRAFAAGASAFLDKGSSLKDLPETVRSVTLGKRAELSTAPTADSRVVDRSDPTRDAVSARAPDPESNGTASVLPVTEPPSLAAASASAELRRLEYVISHDFAEPARIMNGFADLLETRYASALDDTGRSFLDQIVAGSSRMQAMIDDLLAFSRAGKQRPSTVVVDVASCVSLVTGELASRLTAAGAQVTLGALLPVLADSAMVKAVLRQLVLNALIFNKSSVPRIHIESRKVDGAAVFTVTDNGIGIGADHCTTVFELFSRLNTRDEYPGTGTGLALCRRLIDMQKGTIMLDSGPGGGTKVTFSLPAAPEDLGDHHEQHRRHAQDSGDEQDRG
jgi:signal transduction histidine kinase